MKKLKSLALESWPELDRNLWQQANAASGDLFDDEYGGALKLRPKTRMNYERCYGIWLHFLKESDQLIAHETPGDRVTRERIRAWIQWMLAVDRANGTIALYQVSLHAMLKILAPGVHHDFLIRPGGRTIWRAYPSRPKPFKPYDTHELLQKLHAFGASARSEPVPAQRRIMMRDAAIMALMLMYGPRVSDAASMRLGFNLFSEVDGNLAVSFAGASTKGKRLLEYPLCSLCSAYINDYLRTGRPEFPKSAEIDAVWIGSEGEILTSVDVTNIFRQRTKEWLGEDHGPHTARKWLRSSASRRSPEAAFDTAQVLGHSPAVSLRHYAEATDKQAARRHASNLSELRKRTRTLAERLYADD